jgi:hypothetical protein
MPPTTKKTYPLFPESNGGKKSVLDRIKPIGFDRDDGLKVLLYGKSGTGKTTTWATFPGPILSLICSGGKQPGELRSIDTPEYRNKIKTVTLEAVSEMDEVLDAMVKMDYRTLVLDHASGLQDLILKELLGLDEVPLSKHRQAGKGESWSLISQQQYGQLAIIGKKLFHDMLSLDMNVVIIAQEREDKPTEGTGEALMPYIGPAMTPSLAFWLQPACDYVVQTFVRQKEVESKQTVGQGKMAKEVTLRQKVRSVEYCLRTAPSEMYATKFRVPKGTPLPDVIIDPDYDKIIALIRGYSEPW